VLVAGCGLYADLLLSNDEAIITQVHIEAPMSLTLLTRVKHIGTQALDDE
jgi:hypothetical protein